MKRDYKLAAGLGFIAGLSLLATTAIAQNTWTVADSGGDYTTLQQAIADAAVENGDTIEIAAGTFTWPSMLTVNKSLTISGSGQDQTTIGGGFDATGNSVESMRITAPDVTIQDLTFLPFTGYPNGGQGYAINVSQPNFTMLNVTVQADSIRSWIIGGANNIGMVLDNTRWLGSCSNEGFRNGFNNFTIQNSVFDFNQYLGGGFILSSADPLQGVIRDNYFLIGAGGPWPLPRFNDSEFTPGGEELHVINLWQRAGGLLIANNTFVYPSADNENDAGNYPQANAIRLNPTLGAAPGDLTIKDNIFVGYDFLGDTTGGVGSLPTFETVDDPARPWSTGALDFDGVTSGAHFESADFDIGERGTVSFWVNLRSLNKRHMIWEGPGNGGMQVQFRNNGDGQWYGSPNGAGLATNERYAIQTGGHTLLNTWTNIQVTWDVDLQEMRVYHNGVEHGYIAGSGADMAAAGWDMTTVLNTAIGRHYIGMDPGSPDRVLNGLLDDLAFFSEALSEAERDAVRADGVAGANLPSLVVHWDFNTDPGADTEIPSTNGLPINLELTTSFSPGVAPSIEDPNDPSRPWSTGALNYDGVSSGAYFESTDFDVGARGTISFWANLNSLGKRHLIWEGPGNGGFEVQFRDNSGGQWYGSPNASGLTTNERYAIQTGGHTAINTWTNIQVTWDVDLQEMRVYHNGVEHGYIAGSGADISGAGWDPSTVLDTTVGRHFIGLDPGTPDRVLNGMIDDLAFFSEALDETERDAVRNNGVAAADLPSLVVHWDFNDEPVDGSAIPSSGGLPIDLILSVQDDINGSAFVPGAIVVPNNTHVDYNLFFENANAANVALGSNNILNTDPQFVGEGDTPEELYRLQTSSPAVAADTQGDNIGANQMAPLGPPAIVSSKDLVVPIAGYRIINDRFLNAVGMEPIVTYNVTSGPEHGTLSDTTFTQDDLADRLVSYRHDGSENFADSFTFTLSDGTLTSDEITLDIIVLDLSQRDTDYDGIPDYFEDIIGTDSDSRDSSGDGFEDGVLVAVGLDPLADNSAITNVNGLPDTDVPPVFDGSVIRAYYQVALGTNPADINDLPALGDINDDGSVELGDALDIFRIFLGITENPTEDQLNRANITRQRDGEGNPIVNNLDGTLLINALVGNIDGVPPHN